ncbi:hypothetical protein SAMN02910340_01669 [Methanosarcina thermophila]|jgi:hypothetical protein|uniref:Uncharacterized protein n=3 Tax=Methanosarcina thermophila TaxID=2210 RepID=A0A1I6ZUH3_METTE|nr:hypothetical protein [Methanosarcina thermophila]AKB12365.1 hypothetical protein MSTHT_0607 [Methanosarcina thermophila TM-1]AKB14431.1 hypothetical protein MSTHC_0113 [Methanosarcina thermophila CHTI-55]NLU57058.1 hypothetical protein [Methanosarcina thermophila]SFT66255.1 hypothetical protein SAMN02910340_01669 [Methanosarcina thermophila]BAW30060.1 conserved hypothetical protein [Methanosarcina thermophila]
MINEDKVPGGADKCREFGAMGDLLRALQKEEMEQTETSPEKTPEARITQSTIDLMTEINATLKEIAETQKSILEELRMIK